MPVGVSGKTFLGVFCPFKHNEIPNVCLSLSLSTSSVIPALIRVNRFFSSRASSSLSRSARGRCCRRGASGSWTHTNTHYLCYLETLGVSICLLQWTHQLCDQRNSKGRAALPPQLQCMEGVLPETQTHILLKQELPDDLNTHHSGLDI